MTTARRKKSSESSSSAAATAAAAAAEARRAETAHRKAARAAAEATRADRTLDGVLLLDVCRVEFPDEARRADLSSSAIGTAATEDLPYFSNHARGPHAGWLAHAGGTAGRLRGAGGAGPELQRAGASIIGQGASHRARPGSAPSPWCSESSPKESLRRLRTAEIKVSPDFCTT